MDIAKYTAEILRCSSDPEGAAHGYRAKGLECLSRAETINNPEQRADMLRFARLWMSLAEPMGEVRGAFELPHRRTDNPTPSNPWHRRP
jgi:hypothetical protein